MTSRRGIFFNSKARTNDKINELSTPIPNEDSTTTSTNTNQTATVKKKIILHHTKRTMNKTIYSGPRKIFSTNYKVFQFSITQKHLFIKKLFFYRQIERN